MGDPEKSGIPSSAGGSSGPRCRVSVLAETSPGGPAIRTTDGVVSWAHLERMIQDRIHARGGAPRVLAVRAERGADLAVEVLAAARRGRAIALVSPRLPAGPARAFIRDVGADLVDIAQSGGSPAASRGHDGILAPDAPLTFMQTSGSSGRPRIVVHSWRNHAVSARRAVEALDVTAEDVWLWSLPPHHVGGLSILFRCVEAGAAIAVPGARPSHVHPDGDASLRSELIRTGATIVSCVPVQLRRMIREGGCPSGVRDVVVGGAPVAVELVKQAVRAGYPVRTTYGCTESSSMVTLSDRHRAPDDSEPAPPSTSPATASPAAPDQSSLVMHSGRSLAPDTVRTGDDGSIRIGGETVAVGRLENGRLERITDDDGWYTTGDVGFFDEEGRLVVGGRADDVFISGGENISPRAMENALLEMEGVLRAVVVPVPSEEFGHRPAAFLDTDGQTPGLDAVREHLSRRLPAFMHPDIVLPLGQPPEGTLKWSRELLIERARRR